MAGPTTFHWTKLTIWPGDGGVPEDFTQRDCGLNSKGFTIAGDTVDHVIPDCDNPLLPAWTERAIRGLSSGVTGAGLMAWESFSFWRTWMLAGTEKNVRIVVDGTVPGYFYGSYLLTNFELGGADSDGKITVSVTLASDGAVAWADGAP